MEEETPSEILRKVAVAEKNSNSNSNSNIPFAQAVTTPPFVVPSLIKPCLKIGPDESQVYVSENKGAITWEKSHNPTIQETAAIHLERGEFGYGSQEHDVHGNVLTSYLSHHPGDLHPRVFTQTGTGKWQEIPPPHHSEFVATTVSQSSSSNLTPSYLKTLQRARKASKVMFQAGEMHPNLALFDASSHINALNIPSLQYMSTHLDEFVGKHFVGVQIVDSPRVDHIITCCCFTPTLNSVYGIRFQQNFCVSWDDAAVFHPEIRFTNKISTTKSFKFRDGVWLRNSNSLANGARLSYNILQNFEDTVGIHYHFIHVYAVEPVLYQKWFALGDSNKGALVNELIDLLHLRHHDTLSGSVYHSRIAGFDPDTTQQLHNFLQYEKPHIHADSSPMPHLHVSSNHPIEHPANAEIMRDIASAIYDSFQSHPDMLQAYNSIQDPYAKAYALKMLVVYRIERERDRLWSPTGDSEAVLKQAMINVVQNVDGGS
ncbi:MAG: hypothetical protein ACTSUE_26365 [Promethearchaeota archaeon]